MSCLRTGFCIYPAAGPIYNHSGDYGRKVPPVPIPNTEVKLSYAESTCRDTGWEDRASPLFIKRAFEIFSMALFFFIFLPPTRLTRLFFLPRLFENCILLLKNRHNS